MEIDRIHSVIHSYMNDNLTSAIDECTQILEKNGSSFLGRIFRGFSYLKKGMYTDAVTDFDEAEKLQPNTYDIYLNRGKAYYYLEKFKESLEDLNKSLLVPKITGEQRKVAEDWLNKVKTFQ